MAQKVHDLVFVSAGTPGLDLTWSPSEGVMMMMNVLDCVRAGVPHTPPDYPNNQAHTISIFPARSCVAAMLAFEYCCVTLKI